MSLPLLQKYIRFIRYKVILPKFIFSVVGHSTSKKHYLMQKHTFLFLLIFLFPSSVHTQERGELVFDSLLHFYDPIEIQSVYDEFDLPNLLFPIDYSVEMYKVVYRTPAATGDSLTLASGLVTVPVSNSFLRIPFSWLLFP